MKIVVDSYAWIEQFSGSIKGNKVREVLEGADILYTPDFVLAEIARKYMREGFDVNIVKARLELISANSSITYLDSRLALESAKCFFELKDNAQKRKLNNPSLFDAIVLATSRVLKAKLLTGDLHFKPLSETIWI